MSQYSILGRVIGDEVRQTAILQGTQGQMLISDLTNVNGFSFATPTAPPTPTLSEVLTAGNSATNSLSLNNLGTASNVISLLPNASLNNPTITLTDGTTTNTIDKNGYTTRNTGAAATHYINFSDSSSTGTGPIQKTAGISCFPASNTITATTFSGSLSGTASNATNIFVTNTNTASTYYPTFVASEGSTGALIDKTTGPMTYVPSTGVLTATTFSGALSGNATTATTATTATNATNVDTTAVSTNASYYPTFVSATTGNNPASVDADLTYNPSTNTLTATTFSGALSGNATTATNIFGGFPTGSKTNVVSTAYPSNLLGTNVTLQGAGLGQGAASMIAAANVITIPPGRAGWYRIQANWVIPPSAGNQYVMYLRNYNNYYGFDIAVENYTTPVTYTGGGSISAFYYTAATTNETIGLVVVVVGYTLTLSTINLSVQWENNG